ncbi:phosphotransferase family protein [Halocatena marina]|uniref:phosphotransferase family protein n=1 Tax=Halocatena marina TaxID=2934937 RepID=UPI00200E90B7|nr:phosphotransferase [Halocatena marina]
MKRDVYNELGAQFSTHRIVRQLHAVPPHEVYEIVVDGRHAVYKGDTGPTGNAAIEGRVIAFVDEHTSVPVPEILLLEDDYFIAAWHSDAPTPERDVDETWADAAGRLLATLHDETTSLIDEYGRFRSDNDAISVVGYENWQTAAIAYLRRRREIIAQYGHADVADAVINFLNDHPDAFSGVDDPVCCHGWATPEHVSVADGRAVCVIDFEHAIAAPSEFDYWRTVLPTFAQASSPSNGHCPQTAFRSGYESVRSFPDGFERRAPLFVVLHEIYFFESLYVQNQHSPEKTDERAEWLRKRVFEALETLS